jgi:hypothetical protein
MRKVIRLFDSQWVNIMNANDCYKGFSKEDAVAEAIRQTELAMAKNYILNLWPDTQPFEDN